MKVPIEVEIPDGAFIANWIAVVSYLPPEGDDSSRMTIDCNPECDSISRIGMLVQATDFQRKVEAEGWHD